MPVQFSSSLTDTEKDFSSPLPLGVTPIRPKTPGFTPFNQNDDQQERVRIRLMKAAAKRKSILPDFDGADRDQIGNSEANQQADGLSELRISELLQNCIKLSAENKINQKNSWDLQLIDHISEIINADDKRDSQTNFQKASCTLEASVKIYGFRVDSCHTETFKVLGGLSRTADGEETNDDLHETAAPQDPEDDEPNQDSEEQQGRSKASKKSGASSAVLESSLEALNVKKFDVAFAVDPLFHQTSAQFDEGGAKGLLLNNLSVFRGCEIVFDSDEIPDKVVSTHRATDTDMQNIDLSFMNDTIESMLKTFDEDSEITPSLRGILALMEDPRRNEAEEETEAMRINMRRQTEHVTEHSGVDSGGPVDDGEVHDDGGDFDDIRVSDDYDGPFNNDSMDEVPGMAANFGDDGLGDRDNFENVMGDGEVEDPESSTQLYSDATQWLAAGMDSDLSAESKIGSRHWKYQRSKEEKSEPPPEKPRKSRGEPEYIDFFNLPDVDLTCPSNPSKQIDLSKFARTTAANTLLPKYRHYDPLELDRLFLRPSWNLWGKSKRRKIPPGRGPENASDPLYNADDTEFGGGWQGGEDNDDFGNDDVGFDQSEIVDDEGLIAAPRKVAKISVNYARQSKQVDVRILKETLWERLNDLSSEIEPEDVVDDMETNELVKSNHSKVVSFKKLLKAFPKDCEAAAPEDISVHLCFICMLHLANEHNLVIESSPNMDELTVGQIPVQSHEGHDF